MFHYLSTRALDLQLCVVRHEIESVRTDKERVCTELENERSCRLHLRRRCVQQQQVLSKALAVLQSSRGEMTTIKNRFLHFLEDWDNSKALIQQSCISADAECVHLQHEVGRLEEELKRLPEEMPDLRECLNGAREQILQLESQVQTQKLLQNQNQEAHSLIQGLREEVRALEKNLEKTTHEREHVKKLLEMKSAEKEELQEMWSQQASEQKAAVERLSRDLRENEESRLSCQQRCKSLQEQLLAWQQKEEEVTRRLERAEVEMKDLREARSALQQEREELNRIHAEKLERLEESFRKRLDDAEEHSSKMEAFLKQKQAEQVKQLNQLEMELRREADIELDIHRQKSQELLEKYQTENQQLQKKIPHLLHSATQELKEELAVLQERIKQQQEESQRSRESATQREQQVLQELQQAQKNLQQLREEKAALEKETYLLEETVRRECEEREELTSALTLAKEQLHLNTKPLDTQTHTRLSRSTAAHPDLPSSKLTPNLIHPHTRNHGTTSTQGSRRRGLAELQSGSVSRSVASWHGTSRPVSTLPKINKERVSSVNDSKLTALLSRKNKL